MKKNECFPMTADRLGADLEGICIHEGMPVFVPGLLPGEISVYQAAADHFAFLCPDRGTGELKLSVYDSDGNLCFSETANGSVRRLELTEYGALLLTDQGLNYWNYGGKLLFRGELAQNSPTVFADGRNRLVQFDGSHIYHYTLK